MPLQGIETLSSSVRSKKGKMRAVSFRLEEGLAEMLEAIALQQDRSVCGQVTRYVKAGIAADEAALIFTERKP